MVQQKKSKSPQAFEDHVLARMLAMPPDPHVAPKPPTAKKKPPKKARK